MSKLSPFSSLQERKKNPIRVKYELAPVLILFYGKWQCSSSCCFVSFTRAEFVHGAVYIAVVQIWKVKDPHKSVVSG